MTITLQWWMLPTFILLAGCLYSLFDVIQDRGFMGGMKGMFVLAVSIIFAIAFVAGHYL